MKTSTCEVQYVSDFDVP